MAHVDFHAVVAKPDSKNVEGALLQFLSFHGSCIRMFDEDVRLCKRVL